MKQRLGEPESEGPNVDQDPSTITPEFRLYQDKAEGQYTHEPDADDIHKPVPDHDDNIVEDASTPGVNDEYINTTVVTHKGELRTGITAVYLVLQTRSTCSPYQFACFHHARVHEAGSGRLGGREDECGHCNDNSNNNSV